MSTYISQCTTATIKPPIITIAGFPASGKTSLAGLFPNPVFIQSEDSQTVFETTDVSSQPLFMPRLPMSCNKKNISTRSVLMQQLREIATEEHIYKTLVIDTVTSLNDMFENEIVEFDKAGAASVQDAMGGYHKAYDIIASWHNKMIAACDKIRSLKNMTIVFLAHTAERKIKNSPDVAGEYSVYGIKMHQKSEKIYISLSDAFLYLKQIESTQGHTVDKKGQTIKQGRIRKSNERILITSSDGMTGYVSAKSRYEMPEEISVQKGTNPLIEYIPFFNFKHEEKEQ